MRSARHFTYFRGRRSVSWLLLLSLGFPRFLFAQGAEERFVQERLVENLRSREMERYVKLRPPEEAVLAKERKLLVDAGGWVATTYTEFYDDDNDDQQKDIFDANLSVDTRLWVRTLFRPRLQSEKGYIYEHSAYVRFRNFYISRWPNEEQPAVQDDNDGPHVDVLTLDLDLKRARVRLGRQYLSMGQGIAYSSVHDGIQLTGSLANWGMKSFVAKTLPHEENIDFSVPGFDKESDRYFIGTELTWSPFRRFALYAYELVERDESNPDPESIQDFTYDAEYWGMGSSLSNLRGFSLWTETILQTGESAMAGSTDRRDVRAEAVNVGINYRVPWVTHPELTVEYAYGSGDKDRTSVTNTVGGNREGNDHNFLPFGFYPAGYALAPTLSNIQLLRVGGSVRPLEKFWSLRNLQISGDGYFYWKHKTAGGIYDVDATQKAAQIGREIDLTLYWPVVSDITLSVRYGIFFPGEAFPAATKDPENYLSLTLTFSQ